MIGFKNFLNLQETTNSKIVVGDIVTLKNKVYVIEDEVTYGKNYKVIDIIQKGRTILLKITTNFGEETNFNAMFFKKVVK